MVALGGIYAKKAAKLGFQLIIALLLDIDIY
jgi:hypothetical protein